MGRLQHLILPSRFAVRAFFLVGCVCFLSHSVYAEQWLVRADRYDAEKRLKADGLEIRHVYRHLPWVLVESADKSSAHRWQKNAEANGWIWCPNFTYTLDALPNDTSINDQVHFVPLNADADMRWQEAWDIRTDADTVVVAVIDSGAQVEHPDLYDNHWQNVLEASGIEGVDDDNNGFIDDVYGWNFVNENNDLAEDIAHGMRVAGIIGARGNNAVGVSGTCWQVKVMTLKVFTSSIGENDDILQAIDYLLDWPEVKVINASWGDPEGGSSEQENIALAEWINYAESQGVLFVASAGNESTSTDSVLYYPAIFPNVLSVASINSDGNLSSYSNYGSHIDVAALGNGVYSTSGAASYGSGSGTSFSCPIVSGLAALMFAEYPDYTPAQVRDNIVATSRTTAPLQGIAMAGGLIDAEQALLALPPNDSKHWMLFN